MLNRTFCDIIALLKTSKSLIERVGIGVLIEKKALGESFPVRYVEVHSGDAFLKAVGNAVWLR